MPDSPLVVGADACSAGWIATVPDGDDVRVAAHDRFDELAETYADAARILVDIPIGLPTDDRRRCDEHASDRLGCRGISVFYPPSEAAIDCDDYDDASDAHRAHVGHGLSRQAFHIRDSIRDVAAVVSETAEATGVDGSADRYAGWIREAHPELCFASLNGQPIAYSKSSERGRRLRRSLLSAALPGGDAAYEAALERYPRSEVGRDDVLDSMVLAVAARESSLATVPPDPAPTEPRIYYPGFEV
ncbi:DUF429 domain-containing protein [Halobellus clavatus]|jgi:predicted RNase H-like nuclease|uniref:Predicted nuclease (RNAse H fold) n=1 Tax=Halobellus clavatus TaxID=660517 RepID=A0A1H3EHG1_9EURY|nr:DUF429 domain-containing protein [Halobellus clavatus]SDX77648.1 Predicted nuclease (RNAse H fold) [Halobellus clavatus]